MTRWQVLVDHFEMVRHVYRHGHRPDWLYIGEGRLRRQCVLCLKGGSRAPRGLTLSLVHRY